MITQFQVDGFLKKELPHFIENQEAATQPQNVFAARAAILYFLDYTRLEMKAHRLGRVKKCFALAERLYVDGDVVVRMLIENLYVYSFSVYLPLNQKQLRKWLDMMPVQLYRIYNTQLLSSGC